jgi:hypothetical protein
MFWFDPGLSTSSSPKVRGSPTMRSNMLLGVAQPRQALPAYVMGNGCRQLQPRDSGPKLPLKNGTIKLEARASLDEKCAHKNTTHYAFPTAPIAHDVSLGGVPV